MKTFILIAIVAAASAGVLLKNGGEAAATQCDSTWLYYQMTNSCYWAGDHLDFDAAEANCVSLGGHLASIHNAFENSFVATMTETGEKQGPTGMTWVGMHFIGNNWKWTDGTTNAYQQWMKGDPKDVKKEDCVVLLQDEYSKERNSKGQWDNLECDSQMRKYVCKKPAAF